MVLLAVVAGCGEDEPARDDAGAVAEEGDLGVQSVAVGDCFNDDEDMTTDESIQVTAVAALPCDQPHDNEAYHVYDLPEGEYPGDEQIREQALAGCTEPFAPYVGVSYEESELEVFPLTPTAESWEADDREVICAVYLSSGEKLSGSVKGSAR